MAIHIWSRDHCPKPSGSAFKMTKKPVWVEHWPLTEEKLQALEHLGKEQLDADPPLDSVRVCVAKGGGCSTGSETTQDATTLFLSVLSVVTVQVAR